MHPPPEGDDMGYFLIVCAIVIGLALLLASMALQPVLAPFATLFNWLIERNPLPPDMASYFVFVAVFAALRLRCCLTG